MCVFFCLFTLNYLLARSRQAVLGRCFMGPTRLGPAKPFAAASVEWTSSTSRKLKAKTVSNPSVRVTRTGKPTQPLAGGHGHGRFCFLHACRLFNRANESAASRASAEQLPTPYADVWCAREECVCGFVVITDASRNISFDCTCPESLLFAM